jgi:hypothetical protein
VTSPPPLPTEPLLTLPVLARWVQENPLSDPDFGELVLDTITTLLRHYGDAYWTQATLPARARDIGYFTARNYYLNPDLARQSSVGPLQDTIDNKALTGIEFSESQQAEIAALANDTPEEGVSGIWSMSFTRGPVETGRRNAAGNVVIWDTREGWPIEYLHGDDAFAFEPEV